MGTIAGHWALNRQDFKRRPSVCWSTYCTCLLYSHLPALPRKGLMPLWQACSPQRVCRAAQALSAPGPSSATRSTLLPVSCVAPPLPLLPLRLQSHAVLMRAWPPVRGGSAAVHLINNLTLQFFRVNAAILFLTNWKRLVKL